MKDHRQVILKNYNVDWIILIIVEIHSIIKCIFSKHIVYSEKWMIWGMDKQLWIADGNISFRGDLQTLEGMKQYICKQK